MSRHPLISLWRQWFFSLNKADWFYFWIWWYVLSNNLSVCWCFREPPFASLAVLDNQHLEALSLISLNKLKLGGAYVQNNRLLCYSEESAFDAIVNPEYSVSFKNNKDRDACSEYSQHFPAPSNKTPLKKIPKTPPPNYLNKPRVSVIIPNISCVLF